MGNLSNRALAWLVIFAILGVVGIVTFILRTIRDKKVAGVLEAMGLQKVDPATDDLMEDLKDFSFLRMGEKRRFRKAYRGEADGMDLLIFDYEIAVTVQKGLEEEEDWKSQTVAGFRCPELDLPRKDDKKPSGFRMQALGPCVIFYNEGKLLPAAEYEAFVTRCLKSVVKLRAGQAA